MSELYLNCNDKCKCIFIHIPKVAGISIEESLFNGKVGHHTAVEYKQSDEVKFNSYFKFAFVRNPYDRLKSAFYYLKGGGRNEFDKRWADENIKEINTLKEFVLRLNDCEYRKRVMNWVHFRPQYQFISDKELIVIDFVGKYERLSEDFSKVTSILGIETKLENKNITNYGNEDSFFSDEMRKVVYDIYEKDFYLLEYLP